MVKVIVINGAGGSGKDTFIDLFKEVCMETDPNTINVYKFSSVDKVKYFATCMGWDGVKDNRGRRFLSDIKDAMTRYNDGPLNYMSEIIEDVTENTLSHETSFVFFHVREPNEIQKMVDKFEAISLHIIRPSISVNSFTNHADRNTGDYNYGYEVTNDGTLSDLRYEAYLFFEALTDCL